MRFGVLLVTALVFLPCVPTAADVQKYRSAEPAQLAQTFADDQLPMLAPGPGAAEELTVEAECSPTQVGWADVVFGWAMPEGVQARQRLDVTRYRNGFEVGEFEPFMMAKPEARPPDPKGPEAGARQQESMPEAAGKTRVTMRLRAVEPGGNDFWRVLTLTADGWMPSEVARVELPVCPTDQE